VCDQRGALLIFDEVITGFRLGLGGAQVHFGVRPDISTFGKVIGGGLPVGAYGGSAALMRHVAPLGPMYQAGTLSGNPLAMAAGIATLDLLCEPGFYERLAANTQAFAGALRAEWPGDVQALASIFYLFSQPAPPRNYADVQRADQVAFERLFRRLLAEGIALAPSAFEVGFVSAAHTPQALEDAARQIGRAARAAP
jgi:glutamate-1-semialdehyde 2,1-aminomutase